MPIFLDLTRISTRLLRGAPTGIDRVEFAYAQELVQKQTHGPAISVMTTPAFTGAIAQPVMAELLGRIEVAWLRAQETGAEDPFYRQLREEIDQPIDPARTTALRLKRRSRTQALRKALEFPFADILQARSRLRAALRASADHPRAYFHASHTQLDRPERFRWLTDTSTPAVFFLHDAIPVDYPEFCSPGSAARHHARLLTVSRQAALVVVNSQATKHAIEAYLNGQGWRRPEMDVVPLGVDRWFADRLRPSLPPPAQAYFVCVGTIEPRKNLLFLFDIWRELVARHGADAPKLILVGRRGWENENIIDILERSSSLAPFLVEVADLPDPGLAALLRGARALLAPSQVEGFSPPVAEALSLGTPVIASDIPVHREIAGEHAHLIGRLDGHGWVEAIEAFTAPDGAPRAAGIRKTASYHPMGWDRHVERTVDAIRRVAASSRP